MVEVKVEKTIAAEVDAVWALFSNFGDLSWIENLPRVEVIGEGAGMIRRLYMPEMEPFDEILLAMDHQARTYSYRIPKCAIVPFDEYVGVVQISGNTEASKVVWRSTFEEGEMDPQQARELIAGSYSMMLEMAERKLTG